MDGARFDEAARALAGGRRRLLAAAAGGALAAAGLRRALPAGAEATTPEGICRTPGTACGRAGQCCSRKCDKGVCGCSERGRACWQLGIVCCSGTCRKGKCR